MVNAEKADGGSRDDAAVLGPRPGLLDRRSFLFGSAISVGALSLAGCVTQDGMSVAETLLMAAVLAAVPLMVLVYGEPHLLAPGLACSLAIVGVSLQTPIWPYYRSMDFLRQRTLQAVDPLVAFVVTVGLAVAGAGYWALVFLLTTLAATPLARIGRFSAVIGVRRMLGLFAFFYAILHLSVWVVFDHYFTLATMLEDIVKRPFITAGTLALLTMLPLLIAAMAYFLPRLFEQPVERTQVPDLVGMTEQQARSEILLETFIIFSDVVGLELKEALLQAAARGVRIAVTVDGYGTANLDRDYIVELTQAGISMQMFDPRPRFLGLRTNLFRRLHRKIVVVDGEIAFIGGINFGADHLVESGGAIWPADRPRLSWLRSCTAARRRVPAKPARGGRR